MREWALLLGVALLLRKKSDKPDESSQEAGGGGGDAAAGADQSNKPQLSEEYYEWRDSVLTQPRIPGVPLPTDLLGRQPPPLPPPGTRTDLWPGFGGGDVYSQPNPNAQAQYVAGQNALGVIIGSLPAAVATKIANVKALSSFQTRSVAQNVDIAKRVLNFHKRLLRKIF